MNFVHDDPDFPQLLQLVSEETGIGPALIEKDYWVTHCMWALHESGLDVWFKGGTSLSKGYGLTQRFSEDLDLMILHGTVTGLPAVANWTSQNKGPVAARQAFYDALPSAIAIPGVRIETDPKYQDTYARGIHLIGRYPGVLVDQLAPTMSAYVFFEIGRARVVPFVEMPLTSFVHDALERRRLLADYIDNRPRAVRCVHPLLTLLEKLDALSRRYGRLALEPHGFIRHYEDAAHIIRSLDRIPAAAQSASDLAKEMLRAKDIAALPTPDDPALLLDDPLRRTAIGSAFNEIAPMFWGERIPLDEACATIRAWIQESIR